MHEKHFGRVITLLTILSAGLILMGIVLALFPNNTLLDNLLNNKIKAVFQLPAGSNGTVAQFQTWIYGILGATIIGWGGMMLFVVRGALKQKQRWAWFALLCPFSLWFIIDTLISLNSKVYINAVFNTLIFIPFLLLLLLIRKDIFTAD